jgi:hypothetical protein
MLNGISIAVTICSLDPFLFGRLIVVCKDGRGKHELNHVTADIGKMTKALGVTSVFHDSDEPPDQNPTLPTLVPLLRFISCFMHLSFQSTV